MWTAASMIFGSHQLSSGSFERNRTTNERWQRLDLMPKSCMWDDVNSINLTQLNERRSWCDPKHQWCNKFEISATLISNQPFQTSGRHTSLHLNRKRLFGPSEGSLVVGVWFRKLLCKVCSGMYRRTAKRWEWCAMIVKGTCMHHLHYCGKAGISRTTTTTHIRGTPEDGTNSR